MCGGLGNPAGAGGACAELFFACGPMEVLVGQFGLLNGTWELISKECVRIGGDGEPTVTPAAVASAFARVPMPEVKSIAQPGETTLVNLDTVFHTDATGFTRTISLLGRSVELEVRPVSFRWEFGDGESTTTTTPGAAYPARDITHRYQRRGVVRHRVEVTWSARWRIGSRPWRDVPGTTTSTGEPSALRVAEAVPSLSDFPG